MNVDDDHLLDRLTAALRSEAVPEMPLVLAEAGRDQRCEWVVYGLAGGVLAASILVIALWGSQTSDAGRVAKKESAVREQAIEFATPLTQIESKLAEVEAEIRELQTQAALLDARRKADELLAAFK